MSRTRVAPIKAKLTIPKMELNAAKLIAEFANKIAQNLEIPMNQVMAFSDSTVVLCWLSKQAPNWKCFVQNRVKKIIEVLPFCQWNYVNTKNNPADLGTRGISVNQLKEHTEWIMGLKFINQEPLIPDIIPSLEVHEAMEKRKGKFVGMIATTEINFIEKFSDFGKLVRVTCYLLRVVHVCRREIQVESKQISWTEFLNAWLVIIRLIQQQFYSKEIERIRRGLPLKGRSALKSLNPFLDKNNVLRVGGRLENSSRSYGGKFPIILDARHVVVKRFMKYLHELFYHAGRSLLSTLSIEYWFVGGRAKLIKSVIHKCVVCARVRAETYSQLMGQLPAYRVTESYPFAHCGVDFAGPLTAKYVAHRTTRYFKVYLCIFVCLATRAVYIEVTSDLTTDGFLGALLKFISRRGRPKTMYSDNGTNFVGAANLLAGKFRPDNFEFEKDKVISFATRHQFNWVFIPPRAPHQGGMWEAAVKSTKTHLSKITRDVCLSYEDYSILSARIEAILNSRPIAYKEGQEVITPGHFLVGRSLVKPPEIEGQEFDGSLNKRLENIRNIARGFWKVWANDHLNQLQLRVKWQNARANIAEGDVVLVKSEATQPFQWPLGVVEEVFKGPDGLIRVVNVKFKGKVKKRAITSLIPLPTGEEEPLVGKGGVC